MGVRRYLVVVEGVANLRQLRPEAWISCQCARDLLHTVDNGGMIAVPKQKANLLESELSVFSQQVHRGVASLRYRSRAALAC